MSRENVVKFIDAVEREESLRNRLLQESQGTSGWIEAAGAAGFQVTADELRSAVEQLTGKPLGSDDPAKILRRLLAGELNEANLEAVAGGLSSTASTSLAAQLTNLAASRTGIDDWMKSVSGFNQGEISR